MEDIFEDDDKLAIATRFANSKDAEVTRLPNQNSLDYLVHKDGKGMCFIEILDLSKSSDKPDGILLLLSKMKQMSIFNWMKHTYLVLRCADDVIMYAHIKDLEGEIVKEEGKNWQLSISKDLFTVLTEDII